MVEPGLYKPPIARSKSGLDLLSNKFLYSLSDILELKILQIHKIKITLMFLVIGGLNSDNLILNERLQIHVISIFLL